MATGEFIGLSRVLVVEDNECVSHVLAAMLEESGVNEVRIVDTIRTAVAAIGADVFDLAIIDVQLGEENGLVVANHCSDKGIPVLISTGFSNLALPIAYPSEQILTKPYRQIDLTRTISRFFPKASAQRRGQKCNAEYDAGA